MWFQPWACGDCIAEARAAGADQARLDALVGDGSIPEALITHEGAALVTCAKGHQKVMVFQGGAYGLLYERSLQRLAEGSTRDAVLDAYTALEMYLHTVPERVHFEARPGLTLEGVRKELSAAVKTSDRALAAALVAIAIRSGKPPPTIGSKLQETRNRATHAGYYPDVGEAETLVLDVARIVTDFESLFGASPTSVQPTYPNAVFGLAHQTQRAKFPNLTRSSAGVPLVLDALGTSPRVEARDRLAEYRRGAGLFRLR